MRTDCVVGSRLPVQLYDWPPRQLLPTSASSHPQWLVVSKLSVSLQAPSARGMFSAGNSTAGAGLGWDALPGWRLTLHGGQVSSARGV